MDYVAVTIGGTLIVVIIAISSLAYHGGANHSVFPVYKGNDGFWGKPASSVDWCEPNYVHSHYIAETFNTFTSLVIAASGAGVFVQAYKNQAGMDYLLLAAVLVLVGLGSFAFHCALQPEFQMLDEVPMLWGAIVWAYTVTDPPGWIVIPLTLYTALISVAAATLRGTVQVVAFHLSLATGNAVVLTRCISMCIHTKDETTRKMFRASAMVGAVSLLSWSADGIFCAYFQNLPFGIPNPQLHASGWHIGVSIGIYGVQLACLHERLFSRGRNPKWGWIGGFIPTLTADHLEASKKVA